jgi:hypothetical protein
MDAAAAAPDKDPNVFFLLRNPRRRFGFSAVSGVLGRAVDAGTDGRSPECGVRRSRSENSDVRERRRLGVVTENIETQRERISRGEKEDTRIR